METIEVNPKFESLPQHLPPPPIASPPVVIANPAPLGLCAFGLTNFVLSLHLLGAGVPFTGPQSVILSLSLFYGGGCQILTGMWEFRTGNTFGATTFTSYGAYWISYSYIFLPTSKIIEDYGGQTDVFNKSVGLYMIGWAFFTGLMLIAAHRSSFTLIAQFFMLFLTYVLTAAGRFHDNALSLQIASGVCGFITALFAFYNAMAGMLTPENSLFVLPIGRL
ncbi:GPR1/FUN34/yaaH family-domain-containing protein [Cunninghamella echinulata]|nr:GPR1/FUN34/yaaH family-domain-containing protein [Cunninghamella echinulata]